MLYTRIFMCLIQLCLLTSSTSEDIISNNRNVSGSQAVLSRRKRYLVFPEGSSLQLVCEYVWPIVGQPNIWVLAISAALAWQLPSKPEHVRFFKNLKKDAEKRVDKFTKQNQLIPLSKNPSLPLMPPPPVHQSFIPWNYNFYANTTYNPPWYSKERFRPYEKIKYQKKPYLYDETNYYDHPMYTRLHRISRRGLYPKIEHFFKAQKKDGKACLLRALCEVNRYPEGKGSFMQEIIKTIFRNKPSQIDDDVDEYDHATLHEEDCSKMYPTCTYN